MTLSVIDHWILKFDQHLKNLMTSPRTARESPAGGLSSVPLTPYERRHTAGLMRINHAGEICAQGLYQGQALTAKNQEIKAEFARAAGEEQDHLAWCEQRLSALGARPSVLNPLWYAGSVCLGALAGKFGDAWSMGFLAETEHQVAHHLEKHRQQLAPHDEPTRVILEIMQYEEAKHASMARAHGAKPLPKPIRYLMKWSSKIMTSVSYWG